jgi:iron complex outermembrane recepter protein
MPSHIRASFRAICHLIAVFLVALAGSMPTQALAVAESGSIEGRVLSHDGSPAAGTSIVIPDIRRKTTADKEGDFRFDNLPAGTYLLEAVSPQYGSGLVSVKVEAGQAPPSIEIRLDLAVHQEKISVTASAYSQSLASIGQSVTVVDKEHLQETVQPTLGETLSKEPGIASTYYSPGVSRPVIRGQGGDRIRVLEDGTGVADASNVSEDHAVSSDALGAERIEIVRGSATLLYGSNAIGGVVNVLDDRVPSQVGERPVTGGFEARYGNNAGEVSGAADVSGGFKQFGWHVAGLRRETDDFESPDGVLHNSDLETKQGSAGASWIGAHGYAGISFTRFDTNYGIPNPDEPIRIDMLQKRWDFRSELNPQSGFLRGIRTRIARSDYEHAELEDTGAVGVQFFNDSWEGRVELIQKELGRLQGVFGFQLSKRDFEAEGDEAFVPPTVTKNRAFFAFEKIAAGRVDFELGARFEDQDNEADDPLLASRSFNGLSGSGGVVWKLPKNCVLAFTATHSERFPTAEELYANGPHLATFQFQVGDPNLDSEKGLGGEVSFRRTAGAVSGAVTVFAQRFDNYIFLSPTGSFVDVDGELVPEFQYTHTDAEFKGGEAHLDVALLHAEPHHLFLELSGDTVRAEDRDTGEPLPFMPPLRYGLGLRYRGERFWGLVEGRHANRQDRVAAFETTTDDYTMLNASLGYRFIMGPTVHDLVLRGTNLNDTLARNSVSFLKDVVPLPGRDVSLSYRLTF